MPCDTCRISANCYCVKCPGYGEVNVRVRIDG